jgi:hypothetical protein
MAVNTCDGSGNAELQADPVARAKLGSALNKVAAFIPWKQMLLVFGSLSFNEPLTKPISL